MKSLNLCSIKHRSPRRQSHMALALCINNCAWWHPLLLLECWWAGQRGSEGRALQHKADIPTGLPLRMKTCPSLHGEAGGRFQGAGGRQTLWQTHRHFPHQQRWSQRWNSSWGCAGWDHSPSGSQARAQTCSSTWNGEFLAELIHAKMSFTGSTHIAALNATQGLIQF